MELEIGDRLVISMCFPSKGTFKEFSLKKDLLKKIQFSEEETEKFKILFDKNSKSWSWDTAISSKLNIDFTDDERKYIKKICESALDSEISIEFPDEVWGTLESIYDRL